MNKTLQTFHLYAAGYLRKFEWENSPVYMASVKQIASPVAFAIGQNRGPSRFSKGTALR